jgi:cellulose synthase/poly-beta-1,6-N-acetylglucosamine synthase-like glycosyltransferase
LALILESVGMIFAYIALTFGIAFFIYACKYYGAIILVLLGGKKARNEFNNWENHINGNRVHKMTDGILDHFGGGSDLADGEVSNEGESDEEPFISIQIPLYNEKNVARRILDACIDLDYSNYEVLVVDDSRDETVKVLREVSRGRRHPTLKFIHRKDRRGFKGGALSEALRQMDPRTEYVVIFDADFIPPPDILRKFLWYFNRQKECKGENHNHGLASRALNLFNNHKNGEGEDLEERVKRWYEASRIAAVQGYQLHILNKSENWLTRGVREEFSGSYMVV